MAEQWGHEASVQQPTRSLPSPRLFHPLLSSPPLSKTQRNAPNSIPPSSPRLLPICFGGEDGFRRLHFPQAAELLLQRQRRLLLLRALQRVRQRRPLLLHARRRRRHPPPPPLLRRRGLRRLHLLPRRRAPVPLGVRRLAPPRRHGAPPARQAQPGQPDSHRVLRGRAPARRAALARRPAAAGARDHRAAQPLHLRRQQGRPRRGRRHTPARRRAQVGRVARRAGERRVRAAPPLAARRRCRRRRRPRGRHPAAGVPARDRRGAREEGRRHGPLRALQRRAREPLARRGGRRRAALAGPHVRPGVRHGGQVRLRAPLPGGFRGGPLRHRGGGRHPRPGGDGGGRDLAAEGYRHPLPPPDLRRQRRVPHHGCPRGRHPSPRRPLPVLLRPPQAQNQGRVADRDAAAAAEREPAREAGGDRGGGVSPYPSVTNSTLAVPGGGVRCVFPFPCGETAGEFARRVNRQQRVCVRERVYISPQAR